MLAVHFLSGFWSGDCLIYSFIWGLFLLSFEPLFESFLSTSIRRLMLLVLVCVSCPVMGPSLQHIDSINREHPKHQKHY